MDALRNGNDRRQPRRYGHWLIVGGVLVTLAVALAFVAREKVTREKVVVDGEERARPLAGTLTPTNATRNDNANLIDDDGVALWASPTEGAPLDLKYLPPETEIVLALRPGELLTNPEGEKVVAALGPIATGVDRWTSATGLSLTAVRQLLIGWQMQIEGDWLSIQVIHLNDDVSVTDVRDQLQSHLDYSDFHRAFVFVGARILFIKSSGVGPRLVEATIPMFNELFPEDPIRPRDIGRILKHTDSARQFTLVFQPQFFLGDRQLVFTGQCAPLKPAIEWFLGQHVAAVALSLHWDANFFVELIVLPTLDSSPQEKSDELAARVNELPQLVQEYLLDLAPSPHARRVVARLPAMVHKLAAYTRHGVEGDCAVLRCYLPAVAGHNLVMAAELVLAEGQCSSFNPTTRAAGASPPESTSDRLQRRTSLRFAREELEAALRILAQDIGVPIEIRGPDLQADGITRNQLFAIDMSDRPAEEILVEILRRANPDKSATGPTDPRQKLVYVVGGARIIITTRSAVRDRSETLPSVFRGK